MINFYLQILVSLVFLGCSVEPSKEASEINFYLDRPGTINGTVFLNVEVPKNQKYLVSFESQDSSLSFVTAQGKAFAVTENTQLPINTSLKGEHAFTANFFTSDGMAIASEYYEFTYKFDQITTPAFSFSELATRDQAVRLQITTARSSDIDQVWIEGDVTEAYRGKWLNINIIDQVPLELTAGEGMKKINVKARNTFGVETAFIPMEIRLDEQNPSECKVELATNITSSGYVNARLTGMDNHKMKFTANGEVDAVISDIEFFSGDDFWLKVLSGNGTKRLSFALSDFAENYCLNQDFDITVDESHNPIAVEIVGNPIYTFDQNIEVNFRLDAFRKSDYDIYVSGGVVEDPGVKTWIPYQTSMNLRLEPFEGNRFVYYKIIKDGSESQNVSDHVYYNPQMRVTIGSLEFN